MKYISMVFDEDIDKNQLALFENVPGCVGVSAYKNTLNMYFKMLTRNTLFQLAIVLHAYLAKEGNNLMITSTALDSSATTNNIYEALREEAAI